jgi:hypothetical protein
MYSTIPCRGVIYCTMPVLTSEPYRTVRVPYRIPCRVYRTLGPRHTMPCHALTCYAMPCNRLPNDIHTACIAIPYNTYHTIPALTAVIYRAKPNIPSACLPFDMTYLQKVCGLSPAINKNAYSERHREIIHQEGYPGISRCPKILAPFPKTFFAEF